MENEAQLINKYQAEFENACDDLYYGYGYNFWRTHNNSIEDDNIAKMVWKAAFNKMSASESKTNNMKKDVVKINEGQLKKIVAESVKKVLKEEQEFNYAKKCVYYVDDEEYSDLTSAHDAAKEMLKRDPQKRKVDIYAVDEDGGRCHWGQYYISGLRHGTPEFGWMSSGHRG